MNNFDKGKRKTKSININVDDLMYLLHKISFHSSIISDMMKMSMDEFKSDLKAQGVTLPVFDANEYLDEKKRIKENNQKSNIIPLFPVANRK